ncbi:hypothetical protein ACFYX8_35335 [Streptomyces cyaneofuscatus]|uniref:hypothetical protein n=1 Tax=Streptomyces cyaneofuscatus TaxID=66883 RepID=UPI0036B60FC5
MSPYLMSTTDLDTLSDADTATVSSLAARRRSQITVAQAEQLAADKLAVSLLSEFRAAWSVGDRDAMSAVMLAAIDLDQVTPDAPRLMDELRGLSLPAAA